MQAVVESQSNRLASLTAEKEVANLGQQDESTGQGNGFTYCNYLQVAQVALYYMYIVVLASSSDSRQSDSKLSEVIQGYITQIEELK